MPLLFVYGSLKRGFEFADYLFKEIFIGEAVLPNYRLLCFGDYPAIINSDQPDHQVKGELYRISQQTLAEINVLEGDEYERTSVQVEIAGRAETTLVFIASTLLLHSRPFQYIDAESWTGPIKITVEALQRGHGKS